MRRASPNWLAYRLYSEKFVDWFRFREWPEVCFPLLKSVAGDFHISSKRELRNLKFIDVRAIVINQYRTGRAQNSLWAWKGREKKAEGWICMKYCRWVTEQFSARCVCEKIVKVDDPLGNVWELAISKTIYISESILETKYTENEVKLPFSAES